MTTTPKPRWELWLLVVFIAATLAVVAAFVATGGQLAGQNATPDEPWELFTPEVTLQQSSGIIPAGEAGYWTVEDSQAVVPGGLHLFGPDGSRSAVAIVPSTIDGADYAGRPAGHVDPEALALSGGYVYIADTGDAYNEKKAGIEDDWRPSFSITRLPFYDLQGEGEYTVDPANVEQVLFTYGTPSWPHRNSEAFFVDTDGAMIVVEKRYDDEVPLVYRVPSSWNSGDLVEAPEVGRLYGPMPEISDAVMAPDGQAVWLRDHESAFRFEIPADTTAAEVLTSGQDPDEVVMLPAQHQGEGMTIDPSGAFLIITSEVSNPDKPQPYWGVPITSGSNQSQGDES